MAEFAMKYGPKPQLKARMEQSFLRIETYSANDLSKAGSAIPRLRSDELGAIVLRDVYPADRLNELPRVLENNEPGFMKTDFPPAFKAFFYGMNLNLADRDLAPYFSAEPAFSASLAGLNLGGAPAEERVSSLLSRMDENRPYRAAPGPGPDQRHFFTTLRAHRTGGYIPPHFDNEAALRPTYRYVASMCVSEIYSFVLCLSQAEEGGALDIYDVRSEIEAAAFRNRDGVERKKSLEEAQKVSVRLCPGEMIVLHSSRYLHGVSPVIGARTRWSMCSFMALSRSGEEVYCWG